ncbi:MAG: hypothetical protein FWB78_08815 [Treponema sp.]|nr:hypothetical protein [Treponema sp.]
MAFLKAKVIAGSGVVTGTGREIRTTSKTTPVTITVTWAKTRAVSVL